MATGTDGTVGKAMEILDLVASEGRPVRFSELQPRSPHPKATLYRLLQTLVSQGMLSYDPANGGYALGIRLVRLAHAAWAQASLAPVARPHLDALSRRVGQTIHLAQLDHGQVLYVDKRNAAQAVEMFSAAGKVGPAYCTGVGKAMMAFLRSEELARILPQQSFHPFTPLTHRSAESLTADLQKIRARGHAYDREEHEPGIQCVAVPILSESGRVLGALSLTGHKTQIALTDLEARLPDLHGAARAISQDAAHWAFPSAEPRAAATGS